VAESRIKSDGWTMRRVIVIAAASFGLAGCSSFSFDSLKPAPQTINVQLDSVPPGADARSSLGPSCKTPCSVPVSADGSFSVTYTLNKFQPLTIPVQVTRVPGDFTTPASFTADPNPAVAELQPATPVKGLRSGRKMGKRRKPASASGAAPAAGDAPGSGSEFPGQDGAPPNSAR
jgi:hypothetical protein